MARIVLTAAGSGGDVFPFVPVADELAARGHDCTIAVPPALAHVLRGIDVDVRAIGPFLGRAAARDADAFDARWRGYAASAGFWRLLLGGLSRAVDDLRPVVAGADLVLTHVFHPAGPIAADAEQVRWGTLDLHPWFLPTTAAPPPGLPALGPFDGLEWWALRRAWRGQVDAPVAVERARHGLGPVRDAALLGGVSPDLCLALTHESYCPRRADWPSRAAVVGYPMWDAPPRLEPEADWLPPGDAPLVVLTLGTALTAEPEHFYVDALAALDELDVRALVLGPTGLEVPARLADRVRVRPYVALSAVLPHAAVVVHHGGAGTTMACLRAGVPSVVVPRCFDQHHHARRVRALGAGEWVAFPRLTPARLAAAVRAADTAATRAAAARVAASIAADPPPAAAAADAIEKALVA